MKDKKKIMIAILCTLVAIMAVGYAMLAQQLNINGRASIDSKWKVEITNITEKDIVGEAISKVAPSYTATTANFSVGLIQPGDSITYDIEISNLGTLRAKLDSINVVMDDNDAITYTTSGVKQGDKLGVGEKATLSVKVEYNSEVTSQPSVTNKDLTVIMNYVQDIGKDSDVTYDTYSVGDVVSFAGSNWYVIKDSSVEEDYVTLFKATVLNNNELGDYATKTGHNTMSYYWSDTCHYSGTYGYNNENNSGCSGHNNYEGSKVKEFLEEIYINTLGETNLTEVDGYKVRLITTDEITGLGWTNLGSSGSSNVDAPSWLYSGFRDSNDNNTYGYWTMTEYSDSSRVWIVNKDSYLNNDMVSNASYGVRPVINLLKSSI